MPDAKTLRGWERQAWWAILIGSIFFVAGSLTSATASPNANFIAFASLSVGQLLLGAGVIGFLVYGWYAGFGWIRKPTQSGL